MVPFAPGKEYENRADRATYRERAAALLWRHERVVSYLTDELVQMGHDVTLFASGDSVSSANLVRCVPTALRLDANVSDPIPYYMLMLDRVRELADEFDICTSTSISFTFRCFDRSPIGP